MKPSASVSLLGRIAVETKMISPEQLAEAVRPQGSIGNSKRLGEILVDLGFLPPEHLDWLLKAQQQIRAREGKAEQQRQEQVIQERRASSPPLSAADAERLLLESLTPEQRAELAAHHDIDFAYSISDVARFRGSVYRQRRGMDGVFRPSPRSCPPWSASICRGRWRA